MRKNIFSLLFLALIATAFITSCKKDDKYACDKSEFIGVYNGSHALNINEPVKVSLPITDKITVSDISGTDSVSITSETLGLTIKGIVSDCKIVVPSAYVESFSYDTKNALVGVATVEGVSANLTLRKNITKGQLETTIFVNSGFATNSVNNPLTGKPMIDSLDISDSELPGTFK